MITLNRRTKRKLLKLIISLLIVGAGWLATRTNTPPPSVMGTTAPGLYTVASFEDGDTITVQMDDKTERIRMIGVDTPETKDPRKPVQCFGRAASDFTKQLIGTNAVRLEADELSSNRDRYNRLLRHVYLPDGRLVQAEIIKQGYGFAYTSFPFTKSDEFKTYEKEARKASRGLWGNCHPQTNEKGYIQSNPEN